ncbi:hypothetical protein C4B63_34g302 [Trypanosoma cruzi]|uniref:PSI domain-containing protein n=1 Tax=Trypanosoma cruzi TaxID=5693 RepID=A0A2V2VBF0_TRYCR|nr:hypothetical protein C4B63_34g302 [Trypanosoma cruzi]
MFTATVCDGGGIGFILPVMAMHDASMDMTSALAQTPAVDVDVAASYSNAHSADACASYTSCAECVFDASDGILSPSMDCAWCVSTHRCMRFNVLFLTSNSTPSSSSSSYAAATAKTCPDWRHAKFNANCPDMSCSAAHTTNNIYICRPITIFWILLACILVLLDLGFYMWLHAIRQLPWKYEPRLSQLLTGMPTSTLQPITPVRVNQEQAGSEGREVPTAVDMKEQTSNYHHSNNINNHVDDEKGDPHEHNSQHQQTQKQKRVLRNCPICKMAQPALLSPGHVCFWCDIARFGFIPLFIGTSAAGLSFMLLFCVSLKPWFADGFYAYLLLSAYISYALFGAHVYFRRASRVRVEAARETLYISLAIFLHGRSVLSLCLPFRKEKLSHLHPRPRLRRLPHCNVPSNQQKEGWEERLCCKAMALPLNGYDRRRERRHSCSTWRTWSMEFGRSCVRHLTVMSVFSGVKSRRCQVSFYMIFGFTWIF